MTCIVGLVDAETGTVWMGGDSAGVAGTDLAIRKDVKVFRNGDYLIGFTSSFRMGQILHYRFVPPTPHPDADLDAFMATTFVDAVRDCLKRYGYAQIINNQDNGGSFLVAYQGRLFQIQSDFQVAETMIGYDACGCGDNLALGALWATQQCFDPELRVLVALNAAAAHSAAVAAPFTVLKLELS
jgi:hypothetical protein